MPYSKMTTKGQVTVPAEYREALGLRPGDRVWFTLRDGKLELDARSWVERTAGMFAGRVAPADDIQARIKEEERAAEEYSAEIQMEKLRRAR